MSLRRLSTVPVPIGAYTPVGSMTSWITLLNAPTRNVDGSFSTPTEFTSLWAKISALQGRDIYKAQDIAQELTHMITFSFVRGVEESMTVSWDGREFVIVTVSDPDERKLELRLLCNERNQNAGG